MNYAQQHAQKDSMDYFEAVNIAEGFAESTNDERLQAWAYLIKDGRAWSLQGFFGRQMSNLINSGIIDKTGRILRPDAHV